MADWGNLCRNGAPDNRSDSQPSSAEFRQPGRIVRLWDIMNSLRLHIIAQMYSDTCSVNAKIKREGIPKGTDQGFKDMLQKGFSAELHEDFRKCLPSVSLCYDKIKSAVTDEILTETVCEHMRDLEAHIRGDLELATAFIIDRHDAMYLDENRVPKLVTTRLNACVFDLEEASKCFAFDLNTACVYHCMCALDRVLPIVYRRLKKLGAVYKKDDTLDKSWETILDTLQSAINGLGDKKKTPKVKGELKRHSVLCNHMRSVKSAWRNDTMHAKGQFTEEIARDILGQTIVFLKYVAETSPKRKTK